MDELKSGFIEVDETFFVKQKKNIFERGQLKTSQYCRLVLVASWFLCSENLMKWCFLDWEWHI